METQTITLAKDLLKKTADEITNMDATQFDDFKAKLMEAGMIDKQTSDDLAEPTDLVDVWEEFSLKQREAIQNAAKVEEKAAEEAVAENDTPEKQETIFLDDGKYWTELRDQTVVQVHPAEEANPPREYIGFVELDQQNRNKKSTSYTGRGFFNKGLELVCVDDLVIVGYDSEHKISLKKGYKSIQTRLSDVGTKTSAVYASIRFAVQKKGETTYSSEVNGIPKEFYHSRDAIRTNGISVDVSIQAERKFKEKDDLYARMQELHGAESVRQNLHKQTMSELRQNEAVDSLIGVGKAYEYLESSSGKKLPEQLRKIAMQGLTAKLGANMLQAPAKEEQKQIEA